MALFSLIPPDFAMEILGCSKYPQIRKVFRYWTAQGEKYLLKHEDNYVKTYLHSCIYCEYIAVH